VHHSIVSVTIAKMGPCLVCEGTHQSTLGPLFPFGLWIYQLSNSNGELLLKPLKLSFILLCYYFLSLNYLAWFTKSIISPLQVYTNLWKRIKEHPLAQKDIWVPILALSHKPLRFCLSRDKVFLALGYSIEMNLYPSFMAKQIVCNLFF
jgi:hypothetical protein